jgi:hypothetical protein
MDSFNGSWLSVDTLGYVDSADLNSYHVPFRRNVVGLMISGWVADMTWNLEIKARLAGRILSGNQRYSHRLPGSPMDPMRRRCRLRILTGGYFSHEAVKNLSGN